MATPLTRRPGFDGDSPIPAILAISAIAAIPAAAEYLLPADGRGIAATR